MVTGIKSYSSTPGNNNGSPPAGAPEGMFPSDVNNVIRQVMAELRKWYEVAEWIDYGHAGLTYVDADNFRVTDDLSAVYVIGRRVRAIGTTPFEIYGTISDVDFSSPNTTVTVVWDGEDDLDNSLSEIALGVDPTNKPIPFNAIADFEAPPVFELPYGVGMIWPDTTAPDKWIAVADVTIGSTASAADNNDDGYEGLFLHLWGKYNNTYCAVSGGRGANAAADWAANKTIKLPFEYFKGRNLTHIGDGYSAGAVGGAKTVTIGAGNLPSLSVSIPIRSDDTGGNNQPAGSDAGGTITNRSYSVSGTGANTALDIVNPYATVNLILYSGVSA